MANVLLTTRCNLKCPYCFAQEKLADGQRLAMSMSDVDKVIAFLKRSHHPMFRAMGGEPTLHPQFLEILDKALHNDMRVDLLSNATWPESYNAVFARISPRRLVFLLNVDVPERYAPHIWERIERNLDAVGGRGSVTLSFNVFEKRPNYEYVLELARKYTINKVRMSFSLPVVGANNAYLRLDDYREMAPFVVEFARRADEQGVQVRMDNAVPLCMFTYEQAGELLLKGVVDLERNMQCNPVIDIGPDLRVWCCFCLSKMWNRHLDEFDNLEQVQDYYRRALRLYEGRLYPLAECDTCRYRDQWQCQGGCLTHAVMRHGEISLEEAARSARANQVRPEAVLSLAPGVELCTYDLPERSYCLRDRASGTELEVDSSFRTLVESIDGQHTVEEVIGRYVSNGDGTEKVESALAQLTRNTLHQGALEVLGGLMEEGLIVDRASREPQKASQLALVEQV
jgi:MoaA/NifB/PqqE/SkfB family radical SAM enzyme